MLVNGDPGVRNQTIHNDNTSLDILEFTSSLKCDRAYDSTRQVATIDTYDEDQKPFVITGYSQDMRITTASIASSVLVHLDIQYMINDW